MFRWLQANQFPRRYYERDDFLNYLARVEEDNALSQDVKYQAKIMYALLSMTEDVGIMSGARMHSATEIALEMYSPRKMAPQWRPH